MPGNDVRVFRAHRFFVLCETSIHAGFEKSRFFPTSSPHSQWDIVSHCEWDKMSQNVRTPLFPLNLRSAEELQIRTGGFFDPAEVGLARTREKGLRLVLHVLTYTSNNKYCFSCTLSHLEHFAWASSGLSECFCRRIQRKKIISRDPAVVQI